EQDRPQPRLDRMRGNGMTVSVGRLREGIRYVAMGHNTIRGAAGASVLNAELIHSRKYL
ncbi:MAG TPA: aspartate-semialdehyde dehydrogenase, partial [Methanoregulaceae archaeon]|nr:aspartate-semialdehyde dehydrogenase [Methanoregulaceae archaeon]